MAAATYFFLGPNGAKHQKDAKAWATNMKKEVIKQLKVARDVTKPVYDQIIDSIAAEYRKAKDVDPEEVSKLVQELKERWEAIGKSAKSKKT